MITNRHASFLATEVSRVLSSGGAFLTQQVGSDYRDVYDALGVVRPLRTEWNLALASQQIVAAGLRIVEAREGTLITDFADVGAFAWYLKALPWAIPDFTIEGYRVALERLDGQLRHSGPLSARLPAFFLEAAK